MAWISACVAPGNCTVRSATSKSNRASSIGSLGVSSVLLVAELDDEPLLPPDPDDELPLPPEPEDEPLLPPVPDDELLLCAAALDAKARMAAPARTTANAVNRLTRPLPWYLLLIIRHLHKTTVQAHTKQAGPGACPGSSCEVSQDRRELLDQPI